MEHGCSSCCHDIEMLLTDADVERIRAARPGMDFFFQADDGYLQLRTRDGGPAEGAWGGDRLRAPAPPVGGTLAPHGPGPTHDPAQQRDEELAQAQGMAAHSPRPCIFLDPSGACSIHDARPEGCRLYPAVWDEGLREAELDTSYCPHTEGFLLPRATGDAVGRLGTKLQAERKRRLGGSGMQR